MTANLSLQQPTARITPHSGPHGALAFVLAMTALGACATQPPASPPVSRSQHARVIAHRGGALEAPENTLAAVHHAQRAGADWVEVDLHLSADGVPVVIHDPTVDRTTSATGRVDALPAATLTALPTGNPRFAPDVLARVRAENVLPPEFADRFTSEHLPTLNDLLAIPRVRYMLELKSPASADAKERLVTTTLEAIAHHGASNRVAIASFDPALLAHARRLAPAIPRIGLVDHPTQFAPMLALELTVLATWHGLARDALAIADRPAIWVWTVYSESRARDLEALGVDGLITDAPQAVLRALTNPATPSVPGS